MAAASTLGQTQDALQRLGLDRLDAQLLLLHVLGQRASARGWLLAHDTDLLPSACSATLHTLTQRRLAGEPLAYLIGHKAFYGLTLHVTPDVLVPRPDTETLVDWALEVLALTRPRPASSSGLPLADQTQHNHPVLLDLGTGSGAIALSLKASRADVQVHATDASTTALQVARANAERLHLDVTFKPGSWFAALLDARLTFDCIVSNPPYIAVQDPHLTHLTHEPLQALASGADGLDDIRHIIHAAPAYLKPQGWLLLEHGYDQAAGVRDLLLAAGFGAVQSRRDLAGIERCSGGRWSPVR